MSTLIYPLMSHKNPIMRTDDEAVHQIPLPPSPVFFQIAPFMEDKVRTVPDSLPDNKARTSGLDGWYEPIKGGRLCSTVTNALICVWGMREWCYPSRPFIRLE